MPSPRSTPDRWWFADMGLPSSPARVRKPRSERLGETWAASNLNRAALKKRPPSWSASSDLVSLLVCASVAVGYGLLRGNWIKGMLSALALAIALLPEEFPVVLTIFMALGAWRISRKKVLTRRFPAIELLGAATVICVDKTGTLTENRMTVQEVFAQPFRTGDCDSRPRARRGGPGIRSEHAGSCGQGHPRGSEPAADSGQSDHASTRCPQTAC